MALQGWEKKQYALEQQLDKASEIISSLMISMADPLPPGGDTGRHSPKPGQKPSSPYEEGKSPYKGLQAGLQINPNSIMLPFVPKDAETDEDYGEGDVPGHPDWKLSHTPHTPDTTYDDYGRPEKVPRYRGGNPGGGLIEIPWMKEEYQKIHPELEKLHNEKYHQAGATSRQIRDRLKPFTKGTGYDNVGGSLRGIPDALRIQLLRDAMA